MHVCSATTLFLATTSALTIAPPMSRSPLVVPASAFEHELSHRTVTSTTFAGVPLATLDALTKGKVLTAFARRCDADLHPSSTFEEAVAGDRVDGKRRAQHHAEYDWQRDGQRVTCKSAGLTWNRGSEAWQLLFQKVRLSVEGGRDAAFDELLLVAYTPEGVHLFRHDLRAGVSTSGRRTEALGKQIAFYGPRGQADWRASLDEILGKMEAKGMPPLISAGFDEPRLAEAIAQTPLPPSTRAYEGVPLNDCSAKVRGDALRRLVRRLDEGWLHEGATFQDAEAGERVGGKKRGLAQAEYDFRRNGKRVACKSSGLSWDSSQERWKLLFTHVKLSMEGERDAAFDELLLAAYTPEGVHLFRHDGRAGVGTHGVSTAVRGQQIQLYGPMREHDWCVALESILSKMASKGCARLAFVPWEHRPAA